MGKDQEVTIINSESSLPCISSINPHCVLFIVNFGLLNSSVGFIAYGFLDIIHYMIRVVTSENIHKNTKYK